MAEQGVFEKKLVFDPGTFGMTEQMVQTGKAKVKSDPPKTKSPAKPKTAAKAKKAESKPKRRRRGVRKSAKKKSDS